jgi:hypothetical protein
MLSMQISPYSQLSEVEVSVVIQLLFGKLKCTSEVSALMQSGYHADNTLGLKNLSIQIFGLSANVLRPGLAA